jgi:TonB family protein
VEKHAHDEEEIKKVADAKSEKDKADRKERERKEQERLAEEKRKNDEEAQKSALATAGQGQPNALQPQAAQPQKSGAAPAPLSDFRDVATGRPVKPLRFDKPKYPRSALTAGVEGSVTVQFTVATNGLTNDLKVTSQTNGYYFRQAVMDSIRQARFQPAMIDGAPIEQAVAYQISFKLEK